MKTTDRHKMLVFPAPVKLNLFLRVLGKRSDGYHDIQTLFQLLDYGDTLTFRPRQDQAVHVQTSFAGAHCACSISAQDNLVTHAAEALRAHCQSRQIACAPSGYDIFLHKRVPPGSGLGSGSSDAATTLQVLNQLWQCRISTSELHALALKIGMDVPVFVWGRNAWGEERGDRLSPVLLEPRWYLLAIPQVQIDTQAMFEHPELIRDGTPITIDDYRGGLRDEECNVFSSLVCKQYPEVNAVFRWLGEHASVHLSGSGSACFSSFETQVEAYAVYKQKPKGLFCFVAQGCRQSPLIEKLSQVFSLNEVKQEW